MLAHCSLVKKTWIISEVQSIDYPKTLHIHPVVTVDQEIFGVKYFARLNFMSFNFAHVSRQKCSDN